MKVRDSGMPEEAWWSTFFDPEGILRTFGEVHDPLLYRNGGGKGSDRRSEQCPGERLIIFFLTPFAYCWYK